MSEEMDLETMPLADLEKLAFTAAMEEDEPVVADEAAAEEPEQTGKKFRQEIDLGDGSGKQVFESDTMEGLVDALAQAQTHATRKIRELSKDKKVETATGNAAERDLTPDEEWLLSQSLLSNPSKTLKKMIEGMFGKTIEEVRSDIEAAQETRLLRQANDASTEFVSKHADEYYVCPENKARMVQYMNTYKLEPSVENLEKAFNDLNKGGLLKAKPTEAPVTEEVKGAESETAETQEPTRIAKPATTPASQPQRRAGSGLNTKGRQTPVVTRTQPTEQELYDMPFEKLEQLANAALRSGQ